jgi:hypothetical protein
MAIISEQSFLLRSFVEQDFGLLPALAMAAVPYDPRSERKSRLSPSFWLCGGGKTALAKKRYGCISQPTTRVN